MKRSGLGGLDPYRNVQILYRETIADLSHRGRRLCAQALSPVSAGSKGGMSTGSVKTGRGYRFRELFTPFRSSFGRPHHLDTLHGRVEFRVGGVFYDYTSEHGVVMMDRSTYLSLRRSFHQHRRCLHRSGNPAASILEEVHKRAGPRSPRAHPGSASGGHPRGVRHDLCRHPVHAGPGHRRGLFRDYRRPPHALHGAAP